MSGPFVPNTVLASNDRVGDQVVSVNLTNGKLTPFARHLNTTKGLVYLNPNGSQTQLTLNGTTAIPVSATTNNASKTTSKKSGSSNTALIVIIIIVVVLLAAGGAYAMMRRRSTG